MSRIFDDLPDVRVCLDDLLVYGTTRDGHDERPRNRVITAKSGGLTLNAEICAFAQKEIDMLGGRTNSQRINLYSDLVRHVAHNDMPTTKKWFHRLLGAVKYIGKTLPAVTSASDGEWDELNICTYPNYQF